ncbi:MAG: twin-arginine translocation signal domain-containing protein [Gemmatimonadetes bacterium]|nr:twin-arginine translocation signal domain-containing protein [Gemmatimonadota bacterium]
MSNRRDFLALSGTTLGALFLSASTEDVRAALVHARKTAKASPPPPWEFLTAEQAADAA